MSDIRSLLTDEIRTFVRQVSDVGADVWIVGGAVRDWHLGHRPKDIDLEVSGLSQSELESLPGWIVRLAGHRFGVFLVSPGPIFKHDLMFEVALPQVRERFGPAHGDEVARIDHTLPIEKSLERRDYTCNAVAVHAVTGQVVDPFGGLADLDAGILRCVGPDVFADDPLRVLRGVQFCARCNLVADAVTIERAQAGVDGFRFLSTDRVRVEWLKWAKAPFPGAGLRFLVSSGWLVHFPLLAGLEWLVQDVRWHPEIFALDHTIQALDAIEGSDPAVTFAVLLHDIGKAFCTVHTEDGIISPGHAGIGADLVPEFFRSIGITGQDDKLVQAVQSLVADHMWQCSFRGLPSVSAVRRLARRLAPATIRQWAQVTICDLSGRGGSPDAEDVDWVRAVVDIAGDDRVLDAGPVGLVQGRHLIDLGLVPGVRFGVIIEAALQAQINGEFSDLAGGVTWVVDHLDQI